jgi:hypothetical protein
LKRFFLIGALLVGAITSHAETSKAWKDLEDENRKLIDENLRRISQPLAFYQQLRNLELQGSLKGYQWKKDPETQEWLHRVPDFTVFETQEEIDKHAILTPYRFELVQCFRYFQSDVSMATAIESP